MNPVALVSRIGVVCLVLLLLGWGLLALGRTDFVANPAADSFAPSGSRAFHDFLIRRGFDVRIDRRPIPRFGPEDRVIAFTRSDEFTGGSRLDASDTPSADAKLGDQLRSQVRHGATVVVLVLQPDFNEASRKLAQGRSVVVPQLGDGSLNVLQSPERESLPTGWWTELGAGEAIPRADEDRTVVRVRGGDGQVWVVADGEIGTNRWIDKADHAAFLERLLGDSERGEVVFAEATFGNIRRETLLAVLGPGAQWAAFQALLGFAFLVWGMGKRLGYPEMEAIRVPSGRDLADGLAGMLRRRRDFRTAVSIAAQLLREGARREHLDNECADLEIGMSEGRENWNKQREWLEKLRSRYQRMA